MPPVCLKRSTSAPATIGSGSGLAPALGTPMHGVLPTFSTHRSRVGGLAGVSGTSWVTGADATPSESTATIVIFRGAGAL